MVPACSTLHCIDRQPPGISEPLSRDRIVYHFILIRGDLPPGVASAQTAHAAARSAQMHSSRDGKLPALPSDTRVVVLAGSAQDLEDVISSTSPEDYVLIIEDDPPYTGQLLAIGFRPAERRFLNRDVLRRLPLYGTEARKTVV